MKIKAYYYACKAFIRLSFIKVFGELNTMQYTYKNHFGSNVNLQFDKGANVKLGKGIGLRDNVCLSVREGAKLILSDNVFLNNGCQVIVHDSIVIGRKVKIGQYTCFFDHDYDYKNNGVLSKTFKTSPIIIGDETWIGAGCIILRGTTIGKNCVIGAGSIVKGTIEDGCVFIQNKS